MTPKFRVQFFQDASDFLDNIDSKARDKIIYNIFKAQATNGKELFQKLTNEIWEFRTFYNKAYYRLFAFWDKTEKVRQSLSQRTDLLRKVPRRHCLT